MKSNIFKEGRLRDLTYSYRYHLCFLDFFLLNFLLAHLADAASMHPSYATIDSSSLVYLDHPTQQQGKILLRFIFLTFC